MCFGAGLMPLEMVAGQSQSSAISITQVTPSSLSASVGTLITVQGTIATPNGPYQIIFGQTVVATGISNGYSISADFSIPEIVSGSYGLTLRDQSTYGNATDQFQVATAYSITPLSTQIQERGTVTLNVTVTGGQPNTPYNANVAVMIPAPLNTTFSKIIPLGTSSQKGTANAQVTYPDSSFQPNVALTDYTGAYTVYFNQSDNLAKNTFNVGFLDATAYHRGQTATIKAIGYQPNQAANLTVTSTATGELLDSESLTVLADGSITASWMVPATPAIGTYTAQIIPIGTQKAIVDSQTFSVTGYSVQVKTVNLAGEIAPLIRLQATDAATNAVTNSSSGKDGTANFNFEGGLQVLTAFWNGVNVGQTNITVVGTGSFTMQCTLTDLNFVVKNVNGVAMPFVDLDVSYQYQAASGATQFGSVSGQTDASGTFRVNSTLTGITYNYNASLYDQIFNTNNNTINNVQAQPTSQVLVTCPNKALTLNVVGYNQAAIPNARVELVEASNSLFYIATTDANGSATDQVTFGMYRLRIYKDNALISESSIAVFSNSQLKERCTLYGIQVSVRVVDFLGQPIQNANVTLNGPATERFSTLTPSSGTATFSNVIGGDMQIVTFAQTAPNDYQAVTQQVNQTTSIQIKLDRYTAVGPFLIQANTLITIVIILVVAVLFVVVEIYRHKRR